MKTLLTAFIILTLMGSCKKSSPSGDLPAVPIVPGTTATALDWSAAEQVVVTGANINLSFNNTVFILRDDQHKLHMVWMDGLFIKYGRLISGSWTIISLPKLNSTGTVSKPSLGINSAGHLFISWIESAGLKSVLISRSTDGGTSWSAPYAVASGNLESTLGMHIFDRTGTTGIVITWHDQTAQKSYTTAWNGNTWATGDWTNPQPLAAGNSVTHDAAVKGSGNTVYASWEDDRSGQNEIYFKKSSDGGLTWGTEFPLSSTLGKAKGQDPSIGIDGEGRLHVAYQSQNKIYYTSSLNPASSFSVPVMIGNGLFAHLILNNRNMLMISWEHFTGVMTNDAGKSVGLLVSFNGMQTYTSPNVLPGSSTTFYCLQSAVALSAQYADVVWLDTSDPNNKKLKYRYASIN